MDLSEKGETDFHRSPVAGRTVEGLGVDIASFNVHTGGAVAAAGSASLAAAAAQLVAGLNLRRSRRRRESPPLDDSDLNRLTQLRLQLLDAADADETILEQLMLAYQSRNTKTAQLLKEAADTSLAIARLASSVVQISLEQIPHATRFTVSDLGAAAAIANGAVTAALLTARINANMLATEDANGQSRTTRRNEILQAIETIETETRSTYEKALNITNSRIMEQKAGDVEAT